MTNRLDAESANPLYRQLIRRLRSDITEGVYPVHGKIPSEQELCDAFWVIRVTVLKALAELTKEGLLERRQGKGTFVSIPRIRKDLKDVNSFHDACRIMGCTPSTRVVRAQLTEADEEDCSRLLLSPGDKVVEIIRVRQADGMPVMLETNRFPAQYAFLLEEDLTGSLYALLHAHQAEANQAIHEISLCYAEGAEARQLDVSVGDALMCLNETIYDQNGRPLHTSMQKIRGDRFVFRI